jgi:predicted O-linked N-acetylglucosamine transferase (SPINDLY family)
MPESWRFQIFLPRAMTEYPATSILPQARPSREAPSANAVDAAAVPEMMRQADAHFGRGEWELAERLCTEVLTQQPQHAEALCMLGVLNAQAGRAAAAAALFGRLVAITPTHPIAHNNYANSLLSVGKPAEALESFARALALDAGCIEAHLGHGVALTELKRYAEAIRSYDRVIELKPGLAQAYYNRGNALTELGQPLEALASYDQSLRLQPRSAEFWFGRGVALQRVWRLTDALAAYEQALRLRPAHAEAWYGRGNVLKDMGQHAGALQSYDRALRARPACIEAWNNHGQLLRHLNRWQDAVASFSAALALDASYPWLRGNWLHTRMQVGDWGKLQADIDHALDDTGRGQPSVPPFAMLALTDSLSLQRRSADLLWAHRGVGLETNSPAPSAGAGRAADSRIRIAYLSPDFRDHAVSFLMAGVFEHHDRSRFEIVGASLRPAAEDDYGRRVARAMDRFVDLSRCSDAVATRHLQSLGIDILVDLSGHTQGARIKIFAGRPAPVQVNYLGFPGTSGGAPVDYLIADRCLVPPELRDRYSEKIVYLPDCFQANDDRRPRPRECPGRAHLGLPERARVLCCFNNSYKLIPRLFDIWMRLLQAFPDTVLWLASSSETLRRNLRAEAANRQVNEERLVFAERLPYQQHLARLPQADLFLDTLPFNGGATVSDALWMGVPVLSCAGEAMASRMGASLLQACDLPELVCSNLSQYEQRACELLGSPDRLAELRHRLDPRTSKSRLFDTPRFTRHLEAAFQQMHHYHLAGREPQHFEVPPEDSGHQG